MKTKTRILCLGILLSGFALKSSAQIELTALGGWTFADKFNLDGGYGKIGDGATYGVSAGMKIKHHACIELLWTHQEAEGEFDYYYNYYDHFATGIPVTVNYIQLGFNRIQELGTAEKAEAFGGINLGTAIFSPHGESSDGSYVASGTDKWYFAFGMDLGVKVWVSDVIGIRMQANLQVPVQGVGVGMYVGTGGTGAGVSTTSTITQFGFMGGLIFRLHKGEKAKTQAQ